MQTIIEVKNLTHVYTDSENKEIKALDGINLEIRQGEFVAVIGANGSGKSTLARHFNALQRPSEGVCLIEGMDTTVEENLWDIRQHVGWCFKILIIRRGGNCRGRRCLWTGKYRGADGRNKNKSGCCAGGSRYE